MKYFIDTEFIEGFHKPLFGKRRHFIDLISIGIYCENGTTYSAISKEFNPKDADSWVVNNVIKPLYEKEVKKDYDRFKYFSGYCGYPDKFNFYNLKKLLKYKGKLNKTIADEIKGFCTPDDDTDPEFYAYYADYDWVVFCSLFGRMIDLPKGFPMYCRDLKQELDNFNLTTWYPNSKKYMQGTDVEVTVESALEKLKSLSDYPKQENEHSALDDARWNYQLFNFLKCT